VQDFKAPYQRQLLVRRACVQTMQLQGIGFQASTQERGVVWCHIGPPWEDVPVFIALLIQQATLKMWS
jgi:hypothetical protein